MEDQTLRIDVQRLTRRVEQLERAVDELRGTTAAEPQATRDLWSDEAPRRAAEPPAATAPRPPIPVVPPRPATPPPSATPSAAPTTRATSAATRSAPSTPATTGTAATTTLSLRLAARFGACSSLLILCHSLELQPALAGTVGHRLHAAVILVPRSIEHDTGNSRGPGPLRNRLAHGH